MNLIIVESPTKARTLTKFLKGKYTVEASVGHIRDLPKAELGVEVDNNFEPKYVIPSDKRKRVSELKEVASKADTIILATDPDREGEAIAWHIASILRDQANKKSESKKKKEKTADATSQLPTAANTTANTFARIVFHEITESAIKEALENPRTIDMRLVDAQQARRVLDRLVGYKLSPLLWQKLSKRWLSAGRVQSVVVRLLVEREREIDNFVKAEYWTIQGEFEKSTEEAKIIIADLVSKNKVIYEQSLTYDLFDGKYTTTKTTILSEDEARHIITDLQEPFIVKAVDTKEIRRSPQPPYTTSTLQQDAGRKLYFSSKKTMQTAQHLYEAGVITYHRTDSVHLSEKFLAEAKAYITDAYGKPYASDEPRQFTTKSKVAQEAHEAIRPTILTDKPDDLHGKKDFNRDHIRLYELFWKRAVASQAKEALFNATTIEVDSANGYAFMAKGSVILFDGYLRITGRDAEDVIFPAVAVGDKLSLVTATPEQHFSSPPPRYTEASIVKTLEEKDIGRPSTYAPIISTIMERQYVIKEDKKLKPTELGFSVTDFLVQYFPNIMSLPFTAQMEEQLDEIATGTREWVPVIADFYGPFEKDLQNSYDLADKVKVQEEKIDEKCPDCGGELIVKTGRYGKFIACSNFPKCKYTRQLLEKINIPCPKCGADIVIRKTRTGKTFYGCSSYPTCTFAAWKKEDIK
jgi:DNA topoisomerase I